MNVTLSLSAERLLLSELLIVLLIYNSHNVSFDGDLKGLSSLKNVLILNIKYSNYIYTWWYASGTETLVRSWYFPVFCNEKLILEV